MNAFLTRLLWRALGALGAAAAAALAAAVASLALAALCLALLLVAVAFCGAAAWYVFDELVEHGDDLARQRAYDDLPPPPAAPACP